MTSPHLLLGMLTFPTYTVELIQRSQPCDNNTGYQQWIKTAIRKCVVSKNTSGRPYSMPDPPLLIKSRVNQVEPFSVTGVDFTGALCVCTPEGEQKVYICLFTCAVSYAVHLEIVIDLTVDSFLQAFQRFAGGDLYPSSWYLTMDQHFWRRQRNWRHFLLLLSCQKPLLARHPMEVHIQTHHMVWWFWERLIGLTKTSLKKTLGRTNVTLEGL